MFMQTVRSRGDLKLRSMVGCLLSLRWNWFEVSHADRHDVVAEVLTRKVNIGWPVYCFRVELLQTTVKIRLELVVKMNVIYYQKLSDKSQISHFKCQGHVKLDVFVRQRFFTATLTSGHTDQRSH